MAENETVGAQTMNTRIVPMSYPPTTLCAANPAACFSI